MTRRPGRYRRPGGAPAWLQTLGLPADEPAVRSSRPGAPLAVASCLAVAALLAVPGAPALAQQPAPAEVAVLAAQLDAATTRTEQLAGALEQSAARASALRTRIGRLAEEQDAVRAVVAARARQAYIATSQPPDPLGRLARSLAAPDLHTLADAQMSRRAGAASVSAAQRLADAVATSSAAARDLAAQTAAYRRQLQADAQAAQAAQEQARQLLDQARAALAAEQARRVAAAQAAAVAAIEAQLAAARGRLDAASATVTTALTPAQTGRGRAAARTEAPVLALVEAAGSGYPAGYRPTGVVLAGQASWYGPGFVGNPTASGAPYDPERLTCAHKTLPLGTVVRVTSGSRSVSCLVDDRGPYIAGRIIDMSRAGARALGFDGVAQVTVEVLSPGR